MLSVNGVRSSPKLIVANKLFYPILVYRMHYRSHGLTTALVMVFSVTDYLESPNAVILQQIPF